MADDDLPLSSLGRSSPFDGAGLWHLRWTNFDAVLHFCCSFGGAQVGCDEDYLKAPEEAGRSWSVQLAACGLQLAALASSNAGNASVTVFAIQAQTASAPKDDGKWAR